MIRSNEASLAGFNNAAIKVNIFNILVFLTVCGCHILFVAALLWLHTQICSMAACPVFFDAQIVSDCFDSWLPTYQMLSIDVKQCS